MKNISKPLTLVDPLYVTAYSRYKSSKHYKTVAEASKYISSVFWSPYTFHVFIFNEPLIWFLIEKATSFQRGSSGLITSVMNAS